MNWLTLTQAETLIGRHRNTIRRFLPHMRTRRGKFNRIEIEQASLRKWSETYRGLLGSKRHGE